MTVQTVRPDSTSFTTGGISGVGGAVTIHGGLNDASDTTGAVATADNKYAILGLANPASALAANQRVRAWRIRMRVARSAADVGHNQRVEVKLRDTANRLSEADTIEYGSTTVKEFVGVWRPNAPGKQAWNNTNLNAIRMDIVWRPRVNGANEWLEARGAFVDFDYNDQPTVSGISLSGVTTTSFPDVLWTYGDTESDPQVRFRVKVFPQSATVLGGFNPETSSLAAYDSGELAGNAQSLTVTTPLTNGVTYVPYVKVAQAWNGPEGPFWWSSWVAGTAAAIALTPPAAVTPTLTIISTLPDYRALHALLAGSPGSGTANTIELQVLEKCFRLRGAFYNWAHAQIQSSGGITVGVDGFYTRQAAFLSSYPLHTAAPSGPNAVSGRMISWLPTVGAFSGLDVGLDNNPTTDEQPPYLWPVIPGLPMRISVWACTRSGTFVTKLHHMSVDAANNIVTGGDQFQGSTTTLTTTWQRLEFAFTPPAGAIYGRISVENVTPTTGVETLWHGWQVGPDPGANAQLQAGIGKYLAFPPDTSWTPVRSREVQSGIPSGTTVYVHDNELIPGRPYIYRVRSTAPVTGGTVVGPWTYYNLYIAPPARSLLRDPFEKENVLLLKRDGRTSESGSEDFAVFHATGRNEDPITLSDWTGGQDGKITIYWDSIVEYAKIRDLVRSPRPLLLQYNNGGARYIRIASRDWTFWDAVSGVFNGDYIETERP